MFCILSISPDDGEHSVNEFGPDDVKNAHNVLSRLQLAFIIVLVFALFHTCSDVDGTHVQQGLHCLVGSF